MLKIFKKTNLNKKSLPAEIADVHSVGIGDFEKTLAEELRGAVRDLAIWKQCYN
jgi:hypothetical protein